MMIFQYEELKECVEEDFERFYKMGFNEKQIFPAVLDEYEHGKDFDFTEKICIHAFLILLYTKKRLNCSDILHELNEFLKEKMESDIMAEFGREYSKFITDLSMARDDKPI